MKRPIRSAHRGA